MRDRSHRIIAIAACGLLALACLATSASALGNCPRGEWAPDEGFCVLCLPGYSPQPTGNDTGAPHHYPCYTCKPDNNGNGGDGGDDSQHADACRGDVKPLDRWDDVVPLAATPALSVEAPAAPVDAETP